MFDILRTSQQEVDLIAEATLQSWTGPSSATEQEKQDRTERMIREAISKNPALAEMAPSVYTKGSYANNTNVRSDSDVDVVVECQEVIYWREHDRSAGGHPASIPYAGEWTPEKLRQEVGSALRTKFGPTSITEGKVAWTVQSNSARVDADVVPCFTFQYYFSDGTFREGTKLFKRDGGEVENYPNLQLENGRAKNRRTGLKYKRVVRILKRLENQMNNEGVCGEVPSYLLECLIYNCPDECFTRPTWRAVMRACLAHLFNNTMGPEPVAEAERFLEPNGAKFLFSPAQKWSRSSAHSFIDAAWDYMEFDE